MVIGKYNWKKIFISPEEVRNKKYKRNTMEKSPGFGVVS